MRKLLHALPRRSLPAVAAMTVLLGAAGAGEVDPLADNRATARTSARVTFGTYEIAGTTAAIELRARQPGGGPVRGRFRHTLSFEGLLIDFIGELTCLAVDIDNGRAWIGAIVTENNSEHPSFMLDIHQPGKDVWFRVLDTGPGSPDLDRTTFLGFEGDGDIITSEEYCAEQIWPGPPDDEPNARTNPLIQSDIVVQSTEGGEDHML